MKERMILVPYIEKIKCCYVASTKVCNTNSVSVLTWFPPLFGLTNTSRGFMSWEGIGLTTKCFHLPSCWEINIKISSYIWHIRVTFLQSSWMVFATSVAFLLGLAFREVFFFLLLLFNDACKQDDGHRLYRVIGTYSFYVFTFEMQMTFFSPC